MHQTEGIFAYKLPRTAPQAVFAQKYISKATCTCTSRWLHTSKKVTTMGCTPYKMPRGKPQPPLTTFQCHIVTMKQNTQKNVGYPIKLAQSIFDTLIAVERHHSISKVHPVKGISQILPDRNQLYIPAACGADKMAYALRSCSSHLRCSAFAVTGRVTGKPHQRL